MIRKLSLNTGPAAFGPGFAAICGMVAILFVLAAYLFLNKYQTNEGFRVGNVVCTAFATGIEGPWVQIQLLETSKMIFWRDGEAVISELSDESLAVKLSAVHVEDRANVPAIIEVGPGATAGQIVETIDQLESVGLRVYSVVRYVGPPA